MFFKNNEEGGQNSQGVVDDCWNWGMGTRGS